MIGKRVYRISVFQGHNGVRAIITTHIRLTDHDNTPPEDHDILTRDFNTAIDYSQSAHLADLVNTAARNNHGRVTAHSALIGFVWTNHNIWKEVT